MTSTRLLSFESTMRVLNDAMCDDASVWCLATKQLDAGKPGNTRPPKTPTPKPSLSKAILKRLREHVQRLVGLLLPRLGDRAPRPGADRTNLRRVDPGELDDDGRDVVGR